MFKTLKNLNIETLSSILGFTSDELYNFARVAPKFYKEAFIRHNNKIRIIEKPSHQLKKKQKNLLKKVLYHLRTHSRLYGRPGTSIKTAVADHVRRPLVITMDIKNFFPSIKADQIRIMFRRHNASEEIAEILTRLTTYKRHLPHGAPTSPCIARLILNPLAINLEKMLKKIHPKAIFSIYVDDITISGPIGLRKSIPTIYHMINRFGFTVNKEKTNVMKQDEEQVSLNIRLNRRIEPTTEFLKEVEELEERVNSKDLRLKGKKAFIKFLFRGEK